MRSYSRNSCKPSSVLGLAAAVSLLLGSAAQAAEPSHSFVLTAYSNSAGGAELVSGNYQAATEALLWDTENRWHWMRHAVRAALSDPTLQCDGPLGPDTLDDDPTLCRLSGGRFGLIYVRVVRTTRTLAVI